MLEIKKSQIEMPRDFLNQNVRKLESDLAEDIHYATEALNKIREYKEMGNLYITMDEVIGDLENQLYLLRYNFEILRGN